MAYESSRMKFKYKTSRAFGVKYEEDKEEFIHTMADRWASAVRTYFAEWDRIKIAFGNRIPKLQRVMYRAMVFEALKAVKEQGVDPDTILDKYEALGVDRALAEEILRYLGLYEAKATQEVTR